eukprot:8190021-Alexandrium_andersonii.AAC.1
MPVPCDMCGSRYWRRAKPSGCVEARCCRFSTAAWDRDRAAPWPYFFLRTRVAIRCAEMFCEHGQLAETCHRVRN